MYGILDSETLLRLHVYLSLNVNYCQSIPMSILSRFIAKLSIRTLRIIVTTTNHYLLAHPLYIELGVVLLYYSFLLHAASLHFMALCRNMEMSSYSTWVSVWTCPHSRNVIISFINILISWSSIHLFYSIPCSPFIGFILT